MLVLEQGLNPFERNKAMPGQGFGDLFKGLAQSFGNIARPVARNVGNKALEFGRTQLLPSLGNLGKEALNTGANLAKSAFESKMRGEPVNLRRRFRQGARRVGRKAQREAQSQLQDAQIYGQQVGQEALQDANQRFQRQRKTIGRRAVRNLKRGDNKMASRIGSLVDQQLRGNGLNRL